MAVSTYNNGSGASSDTYTTPISTSKLYAPINGMKVRPVSISLTVYARSVTAAHYDCLYLTAFGYNSTGTYMNSKSTRFAVTGVPDVGSSYSFTLTKSNFFDYWAFGLDYSIFYPENSSKYTATAEVTITSVTWEIEGTKTRIVGGLYSAGLPNISGYATNVAARMDKQQITGYGCFSDTIQSGSWKKSGTDTTGYGYTLDFNASNSSNLYGEDDTVVPDSLGTQYLIKY